MDKDNMNQNPNMEQDNNEEPRMDRRSNKDKKRGKGGVFWTVFGIVVILLVAVLIWSPVPADSPDANDMATTTEDQSTTTDPEVGQDDPQDIENQLEGINVDDIEGEFQNIDQDLQNLEEGE